MAGTGALPSEIVYNLLKQGIECGGQEGKHECCQHKGEKLKPVLQARLSSGVNMATGIEQNYCYVCKENRDGGLPSYYKPCYFFYYWLGNTLSGKLKQGGQFQDVMNEIYKALGPLFPGEKCENKYPDMGRQYFKERKEIFDYYYNCSYICAKLQQNTSIYQEYIRLLEEPVSAYGHMNSYCARVSGDSSYCAEYDAKYDKYSNKKLSKKTCAAIKAEETAAARTREQALASSTGTWKPGSSGPGSTAYQNTGTPRPSGSTATCSPESSGSPCRNPNQAGSSGSFSDTKSGLDGINGGQGKGGSDGGGSHRKEPEAVSGSSDGGSAPSSAVAPAAVSGGLAAIGLPAVLFFLYKYNLLPFGIKNFFGGSSKKRRSVRRDLNVFSDDSTEYSTVGSSSYLTAADSTDGDSTDESTVYGGQTSRGRNNNNIREGNRKHISYQSM